MDDRPITPRERIEDRRREREFRRAYLRHHWRNPFMAGVMMAEAMATLRFWGTGRYLTGLAQLLKALLLIPKFCNGLIGVSLTDSLPAPVI